MLVAAAVLTAAPAAQARAHPTPVPTATPTQPPENPQITIIARREFVAWQAGSIDKSRYAHDTVALLTDAKIADTSTALGRLGALTQTKWISDVVFESPPPPGTKGYVYEMVCTVAPVYERLIIAPDGKIDGIFFTDKLQP